MKNCIKLFALAAPILLFQACKHKKPVETKTVDAGPYRASITHVNDLVHTYLEVEPDFASREMKGTEVLMLKPHFYPVDSLMLNAKYMRIESIEMIASGKPGTFYDTLHTSLQKFVGVKGTRLQYGYDSLFLRIKLDRRYTRSENYVIRIHYVAQPEKVKSPGSSAINDAKGLYFVNHDNKEKKKPMQMWTQGETEASSCWFPTIDVPNQKTSEEIFITVPDKFKTISNGRLVSSEKTGNNKRIDHWKQELPHAPYLFVLAVGDFAEVKDKWRNKEVNYYLDPEYARYAKLIFGNTPEMLEYYSNAMGVDYPWDKFHQVVVHDFVSGAMENTSCVVHFDKLQHNYRQHLDQPFEDVVAHELFHHWFGDFVTCESWSNVPLNESFATYGEYLWLEHKYGRDEADAELQDFREQYFGESFYKSEDLIRFHYTDKEDMFDAHSYQKGGNILHMLRKYVGDEAFFASLKLYLHKHAFQTVEVHDLRLAFEEVTGEDLNWYFNQWFLDKGHPDIRVYHSDHVTDGKYAITVAQSGKKYKLPVDVDVYTGSEVKRHRIVIEKDSQTFYLDVAGTPGCVIFDAEYQLLGDIREKKSIAAWEAQMDKAPLALQRAQALEYLIDLQENKATRMAYCKKLMADENWYCRSIALNQLRSAGLGTEDFKTLTPELREMADKDAKSDVRKATVYFLKRLGEESQLEKMLYDSSYGVAQSSLAALSTMSKSETASKTAISYAEAHRDEPPSGLQATIFTVIGLKSSKDETSFFLDKIENEDDATIINSATGLTYFLMSNQPSKTDDVISRLIAMAERQNIEPSRNSALKAMDQMRTILGYNSEIMKSAIRVNKIDKDKKKELETRANKWEETYKRLDDILKQRHFQG